MKDTELRRILHAADPELMADYPAGSKEEQERVLRRTLARLRTEQPEMAESETYIAAEARRPYLRYAAVGAAACIAGAICIGGILGLQRARPELQPSGQAELETEQSMCPFGDIAAAKPWFSAPLTDAAFATDAQTAEMREKIAQDGGFMGREFSIDSESLTALAEVFRLYGWVPVDPEALSEAQNADPSGNFITMHLCNDPKQRSSEYLTACFNFGAGIIQVKTAEGTTYYEMDGGELQRCMDIIVLQDGVTEYAPLEIDWSGIAGRIADETGDSGAVLTSGRRMMLERLLRGTEWYPWSIYVSAFPESGAPTGTVYTVYLENDEHAPEKLIFYPESQCLVYMRYDAQDPAKPVEHLRMRPENPAFFEMADPLLQDGIYPFAPTTMEADFSVTVSGRTTPLSQEMSHAIAEQFSRMQWKPTDAKPQDSCTLTLDCKDAFWDSTFIVSPDTQVIEWKQGETVLERFALDPKDLEAIEQILDSKEVGQPFMPLELSSALTTFRCVEVDGRGKLFRVQLPENDTVFTADLFEVQKLLDTLRWEPVELPVENWKPGYIEMNCMGGTMLFSMGAYDDDGHWLLRWNGSDGTVRQYFTDEAFMASLVRILAETAQTAQVDSRLTDHEIASAAHEYLQTAYPALSESVYSSGITEVTSLPQDATILSDTLALAPLYEISFYEPEENADINQPPVISLYLIKQGTGYAVIAERMPNSAGMAERIAADYLNSYYPELAAAVKSSDVGMVEKLPADASPAVDSIPAVYDAYEVIFRTDSTEEKVYVAELQVVAYVIGSEWERIRFTKDEILQAAQSFYDTSFPDRPESAVTRTECQELRSIPAFTEEIVSDRTSLTGPYFRVSYYHLDESQNTYRASLVFVARDGGTFVPAAYQALCWDMTEGEVTELAYQKCKADHPQFAETISASAWYVIETPEDAPDLMQIYENTAPGVPAYAVTFRSDDESGEILYGISRTESGRYQIYGETCNIS